MKKFMVSGLIAMWIFRIVFILGSLFVVLGIPVFFLNNCSSTTPPPDANDAPCYVQTFSYDAQGNQYPSRIFYGQSLSMIDGSPALLNYWVFDGKHYNLVKGVKIFKEDEWGPVKIVWRNK